MFDDQLPASVEEVGTRLLALWERSCRRVPECIFSEDSYLMDLRSWHLEQL
jgi:hypothetical protein